MEFFFVLLPGSPQRGFGGKCPFGAGNGVLEIDASRFPVTSCRGADGYCSCRQQYKKTAQEYGRNSFSHFRGALHQIYARFF